MRVLLLLLVSFLPCSGLTAPPEFESYADRARVNFALYCAGCHTMSGKGAAGIVPDLGEYLGQFAQNAEPRPFLVQVPGASSSPLSDAELAEVTNWILYTMNADQLNKDFQPYTAAEVTEYRKTPLLDVIPVKDALVEKIVGSY
ncbi:MAG: cytochrome c [Gammaproteobacteria bacterium]|nr:cytochrome c [Gammaproteobacteria bacterium]